MGRKGIDIDIPVPSLAALGPPLQIKAFVAGATAAAAGAIAGAVVVLSRQTIHSWAAAAAAGVSLGLLLRWKAKEPYLVAAGARRDDLAVFWEGRRSPFIPEQLGG
ncbi:MAG TPA: hypothetical protein VFB74_27200 [Kribbellaceae bacterium]|nr:hypothetical protein [Kribbellaceae bacterium]